MTVIVIIMIVISFMTTSCGNHPSFARPWTDSEQVSLDDAESVEVEIMMWAGELNVESGTDLLMEGNFTFSRLAYGPDVSYRVGEDGVGILKVEQEETPGVQVNSNYKNEWNLVFNGQVPLKMDLVLSAGESVLDLGGLNLQDFSLKMGAGAAYVDLTGDYQDDLEVNIEGGVGKLTLVLPSEMRIEAEVNGGLGAITADGLVREGDRYTSSYEGSGPVLRIHIDGGIGEINLRVR
jgi:hypothetical protein